METKTAQPKKETAQGTIIISSEQLLKQWQEHRALTRRVIEAFPEDKLYSYSIGGMRPFAALAMEMQGMAIPGIQGVISGEWETSPEIFNRPAPNPKKELLKLWDETTEEINKLWPQIPPHRFQEIDVAFGQYKAPLYYIIFYWIDNEIHHRGQGYVYLRSLGIEPPAFWDRPY
ncbi:DinB family protein [Chryseolinea sp. H1M3-3]|uniref:DinB family protein n=1 Tax=Chryseolinea sp. H1M3-3 TaxID=3034144 RepID=UPI0023EDF675|nr:DinB family protein [Chryseolinea sp. H1M3-3]